jgi:diguanylate cyclase (GGDEF)-like protein
MRVLLTESEPEDILFLRDVLMEIGEGRYAGNGVNFEVLHAGSWSESAEILLKEPVDLVLLDLALPDSQGIETFHRAQLSAQDVPVILLIGESEGSLGLRLVREGAQDFLVKKHVDCAPLAHAMRNAIERQRLLNAARSSSTRDPLTGLLNRNGFTASANRDLKLVEKLGLRWMVVVAEPVGLHEIVTAFGEQKRDLTLIEAADHLRRLTGPADLAGRIGPDRFAVAILETTAEPLEPAEVRLRAALRQHRIQCGAAIFSAEHPAPLDTLLEKAASRFTPDAFAMRT